MAGRQLGAAAEILDVGCGTGWWLEELSGRPEVQASLHGVELLPNRVRAARDRVPSATVIAADARTLPFADRRFGAASLFTVLSSMEDRAAAERALREAARVVAPGGVVLVWEPRVPNLLNRHTGLIDRRTIDRAVVGAAVATRTTTVLPAVSRRLGGSTDRLYPALARIPALRTHRLMCLSV
jgi:ubiquinone/menaquinone biosynthesis C-methylase UbiE